MTAIKPDYRVIAIDETANWDPAIIAITGRMAGVYIVDFSTIHHICSLSGAYEARFLRNISEHYVRAPDGYSAGTPIWDDSFAADSPDVHARSVALAAAWNGPFYGIENEGGDEEWRYFDERSLRACDGAPIDLSGCDPDDDLAESAYEAAREYECNGEEWETLAPWNRVLIVGPDLCPDGRFQIVGRFRTMAAAVNFLDTSHTIDKARLEAGDYTIDDLDDPDAGD
jgi:hypothetical protein